MDAWRASVMLGILVTLIAVVWVIVLAFCTVDGGSFEEAAAVAWSPEPRRK
jgi:hypothetical protein